MWVNANDLHSKSGISLISPPFPSFLGKGARVESVKLKEGVGGEAAAAKYEHLCTIQAWKELPRQVQKNTSSFKVLLSYH